MWTFSSKEWYSLEILLRVYVQFCVVGNKKFTNMQMLYPFTTRKCKHSKTKRPNRIYIKLVSNSKQK